MSKKKFTDGLESLFGVSHDEATETFQEDNPLYKDKEAAKVKKDKRQKRSKGKRKASGKNFTSDLDSLFDEVMTEAIVGKVEKIKGDLSKDKISKSRKPKIKPLTGLDALIRQTADAPRLEPVAPTKKRLTITMEKEKLAKLKKIAKQKNLYLKDIIGDAVAEFIDEHADLKNLDLDLN